MFNKKSFNFRKSSISMETFWKTLKIKEFKHEELKNPLQFKFCTPKNLAS